jgi:predicted nucleotidyltransferase component of viral defense system
MISLDEIRSFYPGNLHSRSEFLLREYLQFKILELLFQSSYATKFAFLGGTCLRIVHNNQRFSEDLDFDNFNLNETDFKAVSEIIRSGLERQGYKVEIRKVLRGAFHCYIRFPGLLFETGLSGHREARILINLDTEPQNFPFEPQNFFLNKFDVFTSIRTTPTDLLLSQKICAMTQRRQPKGRDFSDVVFLMGRTKPDYGFLQLKLGISTPETLRAHLLEVCEKHDFRSLASDVEPFLFNPADINRVLMFPEYIRSVPL